MACFRFIRWYRTYLGDARLGEALGRENWSRKFYHLVSKHDIVPKMLLAPFESISEPLNAIVPTWRTMMSTDSVTASQHSIQKACKPLLNKVLQCTSIIENNYHGESGHRSPYRPSGSYIFCSTESASCIEDPKAIGKMLHLTMQSAEKKSFVTGACMMEHLGYNKMFERITQSLIKNAAKFGNFISESSFEMGTAMELEAMGVGAQNNSAFIALREAGYLKKRHVLNIEKLNYELSKYQSYMAELEWYKVMCKSNGVGYYDAIKSLGDFDRKEFRANLTRISLEIFWNDIIEKIPTPEVLEVDLDQQVRSMVLSFLSVCKWR